MLTKYDIYICNIYITHIVEFIYPAAKTKSCINILPHSIMYKTETAQNKNTHL